MGITARYYGKELQVKIRPLLCCRTSTDAADDDVSNDVIDAEERDVVGRYARYDEV